MRRARSRILYSFLAATSALGALHCAASSEGDGSPSAAADLTAGPPSLPAGYATESAAEKQSTLQSWFAEDQYCGPVAGEPAGDPGDDGAGWPLAKEGDGYPVVPLDEKDAVAAVSAGDYLRPSCGQKLDVKVDALALAKAVTSLAISFDRDSDEAAPGRGKLVHPFGSVGTIVLQTKYAAESPPTSSRGSAPYTGFLAPDRTSAGVLRLAPGSSHKGGQPGTTDEFVPGLALKLLVDGKSSVNTFGVNKGLGQGFDLNYFRNSLSNFLPIEPHPSLLGKIGHALFAAVKVDTGQLPVDALTRTDSHGSAIAAASFPYELTFQPSPAITARYQALLDKHGSSADFRSLLRQIPPGTVLYEVRATKAPCDTPEEIGRVVLTSPLVASRRGDFQLFFRHPRGVHVDEAGRTEDTNVPRDPATGDPVCRKN